MFSREARYTRIYLCMRTAPGPTMHQGLLLPFSPHPAWPPARHWWTWLQSNPTRMRGPACERREDVKIINLNVIETKSKPHRSEQNNECMNYWNRKGNLELPTSWADRDNRLHASYSGFKDMTVCCRLVWDARDTFFFIPAHPGP